MSGPWAQAAAAARPHAAGLALLGALVVLGIGLTALLPWPLKLVIDHTLAGTPLPDAVAWLGALPGMESAAGQLAWLAGASVAVFTANQGVELAQAALRSAIGWRMCYALGAQVYDRLQRLPGAWHGGARTGDLVRRVTTDAAFVRQMTLGVALPALTAGGTVVVMFAVMWQLDAALALVALAVALPVGVMVRLTVARMTERSAEQQAREGEIMSLAEQTLGALPVVQAFGREEREDRRFRDLAARTIGAYLRTTSSQVQFKLGVSAATAVGSAVILAVGGLHVLDGSLSVGGLTVFLAYLAALYSPLEDLALLSGGYAEARARARRVAEVRDTPPAVVERPGARRLPPPVPGRGASVRIEGVSVGYVPGHPVLRGVDLEAGPGETVAIVGATGAGKSTLVSLVPRLVDPWEGRVTMDGEDLRELSVGDVRARVSVLLQDPFLLPMSVADNIAYGRPQASRAEIAAAARAASADGFVEALPRGYDTLLGERGVNLSGGQRQRIAIARALLKDAPVLILDEPTSALDAATEADLLRALERLARQRTTFVIAHRLSTIRGADRIAVLDGGRIVQLGSHDALAAADGPYRALLRARFGAVDARERA